MYQNYEAFVGKNKGTIYKMKKDFSSFFLSVTLQMNKPLIYIQHSVSDATEKYCFEQAPRYLVHLLP
jgi:hypothetical protein